MKSGRLHRLIAAARAAAAPRRVQKALVRLRQRARAQGQKGVAAVNARLRLVASERGKNEAKQGKNETYDDAADDKAAGRLRRRWRVVRQRIRSSSR